jgi:hypothetical protein
MGILSKDRRQSWMWSDALLIAAAFVLWAVMFRGYLSSRVALFDDAISYYDHIKFYLDSMARGVFPLWDPVWFCGAANTFFLQRMGCFNPFLFVALFYKIIGIPHTSAYLLYLMTYYFVGCLGFYFLARQVIQDRLGAYTAFLLLLFSALGTRSFDSFMILMFTPIAWFFFFLVAFCQKPQRYSFVGLIFCLMIIATTYIPFYFVLSLATFLFVYVLLYAKTLKEILINSFRFFYQNKVLVLICLAVLLLALFPGYLFFKSGGKGDYVMPKRNTNQLVGSVLGVQAQDGANSWALLEDLFFAGFYYTDITQIKFAIMYVPLFAGIIFLLGMTVKINRKILLMFLWIVLLLLICIPKASPIYGFLYKHLGFFKYFRNLHFYLWVTILPVFCMMLGEQLKIYLNFQPLKFTEKLGKVFFVVLVHVGLMGTLNYIHFPVMASYLVLILSCLMFMWRIFAGSGRNMAWWMVAILIVTMLEPMEIYTYLSRNTQLYQKYSYTYDYAPQDFQYVRGDSDVEIVAGEGSLEDPFEPSSPQRVVRGLEAFYYASKWYSYLSANVDLYVIRKYRSHKFVIYDAVERFDDNNPDFTQLETALAESRNVAFVSTDDASVLKFKPAGQSSYYARNIEASGSDFAVESYNANGIKIMTDFVKSQFLVYNDNDHRDWRLFINGVATPIIRSNVAFKGAWVPSGKQIVEFKYGSQKTWLLYMVLLVGINGLLVLLVYLYWQEFKPFKNIPDVQGADSAI